MFDKTGTLTEPTQGLVNEADIDPAALRLAGSLAAASRHPLARALLAVAGPVPAAEQVVEHPGQGLQPGDGGGRGPAGQPRLLRRSRRAAVRHARVVAGAAGPGAAALRLRRTPARRRARDHRATSQRRACGYRCCRATGAAAVARIAAALGIEDWHAECSPLDKVARVERMAARHGVLMVGDGLNDGPALAAATVSASPASAADLSQTVADVVFQGARLAPVAAVIGAARRAQAVMRQNLALAIGYNAVMVPLAVAGWVTPWLAAAAMSSSSLLVMANSFRAAREGRKWR